MSLWHHILRAVSAASGFVLHTWGRYALHWSTQRAVTLPSICLPVLLFPTQIPRCVTGPRCWWGNMRPGLSRFTRSCATDVEGRSPGYHKPQGQRGVEYEYISMFVFHWFRGHIWVCLLTFWTHRAACMPSSEDSSCTGRMAGNRRGILDMGVAMDGHVNRMTREERSPSGLIDSVITHGGRVFIMVSFAPSVRLLPMTSLGKSLQTKVTTFNLIHCLSAIFS